MQLRFWRFDLKLKHRWTIATDVHKTGGKSICPVVFVELTGADGRCGVGEASPSTQYHETSETVVAFLNQVDPLKLSFDDIPGSVAYLNSLPKVSYPAICAIDLALHDGAARGHGIPVCDYLKLGFEEGRHTSSFTIGIDDPGTVESKVLEAGVFSVLKIKLGSDHDRATLEAVRRAAPTKPLRVDANAAWTTKEEALRNIEWLATDGRIEFVEQPMPAATNSDDQAWLKARSPLPLIGDESFQNAGDAERCANGFHGINMKLVKTGGLHAGKAALEAARARGLKTMIGCMIESSVLISAGAHLAALTNYLDLDGNVLIDNDPYEGVGNAGGRLSFAGLAQPSGLRVRARS